METEGVQACAQFTTIQQVDSCHTGCAGGTERQRQESGRQKDLGGRWAAGIGGQGRTHSGRGRTAQ